MLPDLAAGTNASGILSLNHHVISDHMVSYCDVDVKTLFSEPGIEEPAITTRRNLVSYTADPSAYPPTLIIQFNTLDKE